MFLPLLIIISHQIISSFLYRFVLFKNKVCTVPILISYYLLYILYNYYIIALFTIV